MTQIGNSSREEILLINPSQLPVLVHIVPLSAYPNPTDILANLPNRIKYEDEVEIFPDPEDSSTFRIESVVDAYDPFAPVATFGDDFSDKFDIGVAPNTYPVVLSPNQAVRISIVFTPKVATVPLSSVLFIRNNLTGLQTVDLVGRGAVGDLKFGNKRTGSSLHAFDITEKHLKDCDKKPTSVRNQPGLTVKRPFTAQNTGEVPIWVTGFFIDGYSCEGYGFKVLECDPFELAANASKRINIAFTPDFTLSKITRSLTLKTSLAGGQEGKGDIKYTLTATVPSHLLSVCANSLPRPVWEFYLYIMVITLTVLTLLSAFVAAVVESDRILRYCYIMSTHANQPGGACANQSQLPENARLLDLREVARQTMQECKERERSHSPSTSLRKRKTAGKVSPGTPNSSPPPDAAHLASSLSMAANQILSDLNNTQEPPTNGVGTSQHQSKGLELAEDNYADSNLHPKGIIGFLMDFFWPSNHHLTPPQQASYNSNTTSNTSPLRGQKTKAAAPNNDILDGDSSLQPSTTSSKASTPQVKKKNLAAAFSCPGNLSSSNNGKKTNKNKNVNRQGFITIESKEATSTDQVVVTANSATATTKPKAKISAQSSVNDECESTSSSLSSSSSSESSSSSTDNSTAEDFLVVSCTSNGQDKQPEVVCLGNEFAGQESAAGKKKKKKNKVTIILHIFGSGATQ